MTKVSEKSPFAKELLVRDDCFILDNGANGKIIVWKGEEKKTPEPKPAVMFLLICRQTKMIVVRCLG